MPCTINITNPDLCLPLLSSLISLITLLLLIFLESPNCHLHLLTREIRLLIIHLEIILFKINIGGTLCFFFGIPLIFFLLSLCLCLFKIFRRERVHLTLNYEKYYSYLWWETTLLWIVRGSLFPIDRFLSIFNSKALNCWYLTKLILNSYFSIILFRNKFFIVINLIVEKSPKGRKVIFTDKINTWIMENWNRSI